MGYHSLCWADELVEVVEVPRLHDGRPPLREGGGVAGTGLGEGLVRSRQAALLVRDPRVDLAHPLHPAGPDAALEVGLDGPAGLTRDARQATALARLLVHVAADEPLDDALLRLLLAHRPTTIPAVRRALRSKNGAVMPMTVATMNFDFADILLQVVDARPPTSTSPRARRRCYAMRGSLAPIDGLPRLTPTDTREIVYSILNNSQRQTLETDNQLDFSYAVPGKGRFRVNAYHQRGSVGAAFRLIPSKTVPIEQLGLPPVIREFAKKPRGLVLVTGPTGSGKSTTLASMINEINETRAEHILTIEDPIEFVHTHKNCIVNQRELGTDAQSFALALKAALRQDPDVILVGEMRDMETIGTALTAAETGHLVFATLHTQDAPQTIDRIIDVFPPDQQGQVRMQLAVGLQGIVTQTLVPTADGAGPLRRRRGPRADRRRPQPDPRGQDPPDLLAHPDGGPHGMQTMDASLASLVRAGKITHGDRRVALEPARRAAQARRSSGGAVRRSATVRLGHGRRDLHLQGRRPHRRPPEGRDRRARPRPRSPRSSRQRGLTVIDLAEKKSGLAHGDLAPVSGSRPPT